jgi:integrase
VLKRQFAFRERYLAAGKIQHDFVFFKDDGYPIRSLNYPYMRWRQVVGKLNIRYREPYRARHSSVSWNLMTGGNPLWVAKQHGHSVQVMPTTYGTWIEGATEADIEMIKAAMAGEATGSHNSPLLLPLSPRKLARICHRSGGA